MHPLHYYLITCGLVLSAVFAWMIKRRIGVTFSGELAIADVVKHEMRNGDDSILYHAVLEFEDHHGVRRQIVSNLGWGKPRPQLGTKIKIRYQRENSELAVIDNFYHMWLGPLVVAAFSAALFFFAVYPNSCLNHPSEATCKWDGVFEL